MKKHSTTDTTDQEYENVTAAADLQVSIFKPYSAGTDFRRQNLTSVDVRFWRLKSIPVL